MSSQTTQAKPATSPLVCLIVVSIVQFLNPFMSSAVIVALPTIGAEFGATAMELSMIQVTYILGVAIFLLPFGRLADIHGRKRTFITGICVVMLCTIAIGWAQGTGTFILLRFLQGVGTAAITSTSFAILSSVFPAERRGRAMGIIVGSVYVGLAAGPIIAGVITTQLGWRWVFYLMVIAQGLALSLTLYKLKGEWADARGESFDWFGSIVYAAALSTVIWGAHLLKKTEFGWLVFLAGMVGLIFFAKIEIKSDKPLLDVQFLSKNKTFMFGNITTLINYAASFGVVFWFTLYLQHVKGMNPQQAGFFMMIQPCVQALCSPLSGRLADTYSPSRLATFGMVLCTAGLLSATFIGPSSSLSALVIVVVLLGIGFGFFASPNMTAIIGSVDKRYYGTASSMIATMRTVGMLTSMTFISLILSYFMGDDPLTPSNKIEFVNSMHFAMIMFAVMSVMGVGFSMVRSR
jgi:EmrB/QacA subfamily drug resistance transporter